MGDESSGTVRALDIKSSIHPTAFNSNNNVGVLFWVSHFAENKVVLKKNKKKRQACLFGRCNLIFMTRLCSLCACFLLHDKEEKQSLVQTSKSSKAQNKGMK